jgi:NAD-dependent DNA ligase
MRDFLDLASTMYYEGHPILSDAEFDLLADKHNYTTVGYEVTDAVPHTYQMYSLQKCFTNQVTPLDIKDCIKTPKLDGAAVSLLYVNGLLQLALTRGDGIHGRDITDKMAQLVPNCIENKELIQITGEVIAPSSVPNSRNFASGSLGLKGLSGLEEFKTRPLVFVAYDATPHLDTTYACSLEILHKYNFNVVTRFNAVHFPMDGLVFRLKSNAKYDELGHTAKHPRGAFALKEQVAGVETTLLDVVWQLGKSGVVSPVAILDPVVVGDATVSRATLHNIEYIRDLNLEIGCKVEVIRSGEIIPRIVRRLD